MEMMNPSAGGNAPEDVTNLVHGENAPPATASDLEAIQDAIYSRIVAEQSIARHFMKGDIPYRNLHPQIVTWILSDGGIEYVRYPEPLVLVWEDTHRFRIWENL